MENFISYEKLSKKGSDPTAASGGCRGRAESRHPEERKQQGLQSKQSPELEA